MRQIVSVFFMATLFWSNVVSETCVTPSGKSSTCVSLDDCPQLRAGLEGVVTGEIATYIRRSGCGYGSRGPKVCCGPLPETATTEPPIIGNVPEDALPAPDGECGIDTNGDRIIGGEETELDEFRWMAMLGYKNKTTGTISYQCGGSLINHRYVLTAAHCVTGLVEVKVGPLVTVRLGEYDTRTPIDCKNNTCADRPQEIAVAAARAHPGYNPKAQTSRDDIAIVRLAERAIYSHYVKPICLAGVDVRTDVGLDVLIAGWGRTPDQFHSNVKLKLAMPIVEKDECTRKFRTTFGVALGEYQLCAGGERGKDSCKGDSGGPLMKKRRDGIWEAIAVLSFGTKPCALTGWPGVYTSVVGYNDWIRSTMQSLNQ